MGTVKRVFMKRPFKYYLADVTSGDVIKSRFRARSSRGTVGERENRWRLHKFVLNFFPLYATHALARFDVNEFIKTDKSEGVRKRVVASRFPSLSLSSSCLHFVLLIPSLRNFYW